jgi:Flp pilus assembly protein TadB
MTALQLSLLVGALFATGVLIPISGLLPRHPALGAYLDASSGAAPSLTTSAITGPATTAEDRIGAWLQRRIGGRLHAPTLELELLRIPVHRFLGQKAMFALVGLALPTVLAAVLYVTGARIPLGFPVIGSLVLAAGLSFIPDYNVRSNAQQARDEFAFVLGSYMDLVALERRAGSSPRQALEEAAEIADSWVFHRLAEELAHSRLSGASPWDRLRVLGERYGVAELTELAHIMRIAGAESAGVYETLKQRSRALRKAHLAKELTEANATSTKRDAPMAALGVVFMLMLITPALLSILLSGL